MTAALFVYFASIVGNIASLLTGALTILIIVSAFTLFIAGLSYVEDELKDWDRWKTIKTLVIITLVVGTFRAFIPTERAVYLTAGAYVAQQMVTSETSNKVMNIINYKLDEYLESLATGQPKEKSDADKK